MFRVSLIAGALALCPLAFAAAQDTGVQVTAADAAADSENWREVDLENLIVFETTKGRIVIEMLPEVAPAHAEQFRALIRSGDFNGTSFHRVIDDFMAQGGDIFALHGRESGLPDIPGEFTFRRDPVDMVITTLGDAENARNGYYLGFPIKTQAAWLAEMSNDGLVESYIPHCAGVVSTARTSDPNSANSQFFLMRGRAEHLDRQYTAWGRILEGVDVVYAIQLGEPPVRPDVLQRAAMAADLGGEDAIRAYVMRTDGPVFAQQLVGIENPRDADVCDLEPVPAIIVD